MEGQITKVQPLIEERRLCGELDHPQNDTVKLSNASHLVTKLEMKGDELIGEAEILNTPAGLTAKALIEGGVRVGISSRGMGTLSEDANGKKVVNDDFRLVTFDLVADPSTRGAFPGLSESTESKFVRESQDKLKKESNFVTMIEARLRDSYEPFIEEATKRKPLKGGQKKLDRNKNGRLDSQDFEMLRNESMEAVKEEGSWHQIAFALAEAFGLVSEEVPFHRMSTSQRAQSLKDRNVKVRASGNSREQRNHRSIMAHTSYQQIGDMMAEALGLIEMYGYGDVANAEAAARRQTKGKKTRGSGDNERPAKTPKQITKQADDIRDKVHRRQRDGRTPAGVATYTTRGSKTPMPGKK
jgi:hypothetical protein